MYKRKLIFSISLLISLMLTSCATLPPQPTVAAKPWQQQRAQLEQLKTWRLAGRMSIHTPKQSQIVSLTWQQLPQNYQINVYGPLNLGSVKIVGAKDQVTLWKSASQSVSASNPEQLMQAELGWQLPISNLHYWIRNLPAPALPAKTHLDNQGRLIMLQQQGWTINYAAFQNVQEVNLPARIDLSNGAIHLRLVIRQWQLTF